MEVVMLKKYFIIGIIILLSSTIYGQIPKLINYQGILTDGDGKTITGNCLIKFTLYDSETGGNELWSETHNITVLDGLLSVLLGSTKPIPYSVFETDEVYLALKAGSDDEMIPRKRLVGVGYAFHANHSDSLNGFVASDFVRTLESVTPADGNIDLVAGDNITITPDNQNNRITISAQGGSGGDNLGDHTATQNIKLNNNWLSGDGGNEGVYVNNSGRVGIGTGTPGSDLHVDGIDGVLFEGTFENGTIPKEGSGARMMWYPAKAAFRAGHLSRGTYWDADSIGEYSIAMGRNTKAIGENSTALGCYTEAIGEKSTALGYNTEARGNYSTTMGYATKTSGSNSTSMGYSTEAQGSHSTAMGYATKAIGRGSTALGGFTNARAWSLAIGRFNIDEGSIDSWYTNDFVLTIGDGYLEDNRSNLLTVKKNGDMWIQGTLTENSDKHLKNEIIPLNNSIDRLKQLTGVNFTWKDTETMGNEKHIGLLAQDVEKVFPELVGENEGYKTTNYTGLIPVLVEAIKEQQQMIDELREQIKQLKSE